MITSIDIQPITMTESLGDVVRKREEGEIFSIKQALQRDIVATLRLNELESTSPTETAPATSATSTASANEVPTSTATIVNNTTVSTPKIESAAAAPLPSNVTVTNTQAVDTVLHNPKQTLNYLTDAQYKGTKYTQYDNIIVELSRKYGVDPNLVKKIIKTESNFNSNAKSSAGALGLMQLMPANVKAQGIQNPYDPAQSIEGGIKLLKGYLTKYNGDLVLSLAAYNAGPGNVRKYGGVPPFKETQGYIKKILGIDVTK